MWKNTQKIKYINNVNNDIICLQALPSPLKIFLGSPCPHKWTRVPLRGTQTPLWQTTDLKYAESVTSLKKDFTFSSNHSFNYLFIYWLKFKYLNHCSHFKDSKIPEQFDVRFELLGKTYLCCVVVVIVVAGHLWPGSRKTHKHAAD